VRIDKIDEGKRGEEFAASFLRRKGYQIIDRNFRIRGGEIDLIAIDPSTGSGEKTLVFIEVKTRTSDEYGTPLEAIGYYKIRTLIKAAHLYKLKHPQLPNLMRIDAVGVVVNRQNQLLTIDLVKNIT
jgi:putative endonuclease